VRGAERNKLVSSKMGDLLTIKFFDMKCDEGNALWFHSFLYLELHMIRLVNLRSQLLVSLYKERPCIFGPHSRSG